MSKNHILCNDKYGIYYGEMESYNGMTKVAIVENCRHVARWYGYTGGITSLAAKGLCGPHAEESLIGAPCRAVLSNIVNVFAVSDEAAETFDKIVPYIPKDTVEDND